VNSLGDTAMTKSVQIEELNTLVETLVDNYARLIKLISRHFEEVADVVKKLESRVKKLEDDCKRR
jgi:hypothetical protein